MSEKRNLQNDLRGTYARSWTVSVDQNGKRLLRAVLKAALPFFAGGARRNRERLLGLRTGRRHERLLRIVRLFGLFD